MCKGSRSWAKSAGSSFLFEGYWRAYQTGVRVSNKSHQTTILCWMFPKLVFTFSVFLIVTLLYDTFGFSSETSERSDFPKIHFREPQRPVPQSLFWNCGGNRYTTASVHFQITKPENSLESHLTDTKTNSWSTSFTACFMYLKTILVFGKGGYILLL